MIVRKIAFIEAGSSEFHLLNRFTVARVGTVLLSTILKERGYEVKTFIEDIAAPDWSFVESADLVCISTLTSTAPRAYAIGDRVKARGIPVVMGGVHPTYLPEEALRHSDFVVRGEGEFALQRLLNCLEKRKPRFKNIEGLSYRDASGSVVHNAPGQYLTEEEMNNLPVPDFSLVRNWKATTIYPVSTSRGCPFECRFCSVIGMFGRKYRFKSGESALRELRHIQTVSKATRFFVDDNFTANKKRSKELLRAMIAEGLTDTWSAQTRTDVAGDPELLRLMKDSGGHTLYVGFESINPKTLAAYNKKHVLNDIIKCVRTVKDHGLNIHGMFVMGADTDDIKVIRETADFAIRSGIDTTQILALTPLPGTQIFEEMMKSGRILHTDWSKYNLQHVVFRPALMSPETLQVETVNAMQRFFSWKYILRRLAKFDLHYAGVGLYGKSVSNSMAKKVTAYLNTLRKLTPAVAS